jgi:hypothetical protein
LNYWTAAVQSLAHATVIFFSINRKAKRLRG